MHQLRVYQHMHSNDSILILALLTAHPLIFYLLLFSSKLGLVKYWILVASLHSAIIPSKVNRFGRRWIGEIECFYLTKQKQTFTCLSNCRHCADRALNMPRPVPNYAIKKCPRIHISSDTDTNQLIQTAKEHVISSFSKYLRNHVFLFAIIVSWLVQTKSQMLFSVPMEGNQL